MMEQIIMSGLFNPLSLIDGEGTSKRRPDGMKLYY